MRWRQEEEEKKEEKKKDKAIHLIVWIKITNASQGYTTVEDEMEYFVFSSCLFFFFFYQPQHNSTCSVCLCEWYLRYTLPLGFSSTSLTGESSFSFLPFLKYNSQPFAGLTIVYALFTFTTILHLCLACFLLLLPPPLQRATMDNRHQWSVHRPIQYRQSVQARDKWAVVWHTHIYIQEKEEDIFSPAGYNCKQLSAVVYINSFFLLLVSCLVKKTVTRIQMHWRDKLPVQVVRKTYTYSNKYMTSCMTTLYTWFSWKYVFSISSNTFGPLTSLLSLALSFYVCCSLSLCLSICPRLFKCH